MANMSFWLKDETEYMLRRLHWDKCVSMSRFADRAIREKLENDKIMQELKNNK